MSELNSLFTLEQGPSKHKLCKYTAYRPNIDCIHGSHLQEELIYRTSSLALVYPLIAPCVKRDIMTVAK